MTRWFPRAASALAFAAVASACASGPSSDGGIDVVASDAIDVATPTDAGPDCGTRDPARWPDAALPDGRIVRGPYATRVVSMMPGAGAGFGAMRMPDVVLGPPVGAGDMAGGTDVYSLGAGGSICLAFDDVAIVDGPGADFLVSENPFIAAGTATIYDELGEVSVSDDGVTYHTFACTQTGPPYTGCAGWNPVYSRPGNGICPDDVLHAGSDPFDLATVGLTRARYVCIRDLRTQPGASPTAGFDLDAITAVHWE